MAQRQPDGHTLRHHLEAARAAGSGTAAGELAGPPAPRALYLWHWFGELHAARRAGGFGPEPIAYADLDAWARLSGRYPRPWEVRWLMDLDAVWLAEQPAPVAEAGATRGAA